MKEISLSQFCEERTQSEAARILGRSQGAVSQMLKAGRQVFIVEHTDGSFSSYEKKPLEPRTTAA